eukprot:2723529-Prymnesium_polylepis.1
MSRVRTRVIGCRVVYCSPVRPMHTPHSPTAPDDDATRSRPAGDTHSMRQLWVGRADGASAAAAALGAALILSRWLTPKKWGPREGNALS